MFGRCGLAPQCSLSTRQLVATTTINNQHRPRRPFSPPWRQLASVPRLPPHHRPRRRLSPPFPPPRRQLASMSHPLLLGARARPPPACRDLRSHLASFFSASRARARARACSARLAAGCGTCAPAQQSIFHSYLLTRAYVTSHKAGSVVGSVVGSDPVRSGPVRSQKKKEKRRESRVEEEGKQATAIAIATPKATSAKTITPSSRR